MKHLSKILLILFVLASSTGVAQNLKFGHINSQELVALMSETDSAQVKLEAHRIELESELQALQSEFKIKYNEYNQKQATWVAAVLESKTKELQELDGRIQQYQQTASQEYQQLQQALFAPVFKKANDVIQQIGKEMALIYVFDTSSGSIPFINADISVDVLPLAKKAMGISPDKKPMQMNEQPAL